MPIFFVTAPTGEVTSPLTQWLAEPDDAEHAIQLAREWHPDVAWDKAVPFEEWEEPEENPDLLAVESDSKRRTNPTGDPGLVSRLKF